ncbi:non-ribosomal peptide synthetase [Streptosporangium lutulentum]|uniref:Amino acid adenylation domain-containing protein n=1 Tax=Streptosporangium lutulentum TaxID=1461250 RepID=A0ABT9QFS4_9ACTN|nr:amino acid adenylation domain-containing protein [Streptosporangium lutulentum]MDP9845620.1 amino acid adenylation domain-containing protein [Streptosporangium lutulentum]
MTPREWEAPASFGQERIWLADQMDPGSPVFNLQCSFVVPHPLEPDQVLAALRVLTERHEVLRTSFRLVDGVLHQVVHAEVDLDVRMHDLRALPVEEARTEAYDLAVAATGAAIPTGRAPLWWVTAIRTENARWVINFVIHHAVFDATSAVILERETIEVCAAAAAGRPADLPELPIQYADYAAWQRGQLTGPVLTEQTDHWRSRLTGLPAVHTLPTDRPRPARLGYAGDEVRFTIPEEVQEQAAATGRRSAATPFMVFLTAYVALLSRLSRDDDTVVGVTLSGRDLPEVAGLVGMFVNQMVLRTDASGDPTFTELLGRVRTALLDAMENGQLPFQAVVEAIAPQRDPGVQPLYQIGFNFIPDSGIEPIPYTTSKDDLAFDLTTGISRLLYRTDLFDRGTAEAFVARYLRVLAAGAADPETRIGDLPLMDETERASLLETGAQEPPREHPTVRHMVEAQVARTPDATAVITGDRRLTYTELDEAAERVADRLRGSGVGPESLVAVYAEPCLELLPALLGVWKAGAGYVPVDPAYPAGRVAYMLADSAAAAVLTQRHLAGTLPATGATVLTLDDLGDRAGPAAPSQRAAGPGNIAYVIYTSGSTGTPKGVVVEHGSVAAYLAWAGTAYPGLAGQALLHSPISFDLTVTGLFGPLTVGGSVRLAALDEITAGDRPTFLKATPSHLALLAALPDHVAPGADLVLGGEALPADWVAAWRDRHPGATVVNEYGPTEATVGCVTAHVAPGEAPPVDRTGSVGIGRPAPGNTVYVLDDGLRPVPAGVIGELYVAGPQVTRGYLNRPGATAAAYVPCPYGPPGLRMYRTGDLARRRADGGLEFAGRADDQIKLHGYRIEPGEIEAALRAQPGVRDAAVSVREDTADGRRLVAYLVGEADPTAVGDALAATLPAHMVPAGYVALDALPLTANGKLDHAALPAPAAPSRGYVAPKTIAEELVAEVFAELLKVEKVGVDDDFFELGGNSLLAIRAIARIRSQIEVDIPVRGLFSYATVADLAAEIERRLTEDLDRLSDEDVERLLTAEGDGRA